MVERSASRYGYALLLASANKLWSMGVAITLPFEVPSGVLDLPLHPEYSCGSCRISAPQMDNSLSDCKIRRVCDVINYTSNHGAMSQNHYTIPIRTICHRWGILLLPSPFVSSTWINIIVYLPRMMMLLDLICSRHKVPSWSPRLFTKEKAKYTQDAYQQLFRRDNIFFQIYRLPNNRDDCDLERRNFSRIAAQTA